MQNVAPRVSRASRDVLQMWLKGLLRLVRKLQLCYLHAGFCTWGRSPHAVRVSECILSPYLCTGSRFPCETKSIRQPESSLTVLS